MSEHLGMLFILAGVVATIVGALLMLLEGLSKTRESVRTGAVLFIGPIPVVFGSDVKVAKLALLIGLVMVALIMLMLIAYRLVP